MIKLLLSVIEFIGGSKSIIERGIGLLEKKADVDLSKFNTMTDAQRGVAIEAIRSESARVVVQQNLVLAAMSHPVWWWAWGLFVFPVGAYHATIFIASTLGIDPATFAVRRVPPTQEQWALAIIQTIFVAQVTTGIVGGITQSFLTAFRK